MLTFTAKQLHRLTQTVFVKAGAPEDIAERVADTLVDANLSGHDSHGVMRIPQYVKAIAEGEIDLKARPKVVQETPTSALVDGGWTFGQVGAAMATRVAVAKAKEAGVAVVGLVKAHHIGRLGEYSEMAAAEGIILMVFAGGFGGAHGQPPFGGAKVAYGTNPLSFGIPAGDKPDVMVDFATTGVAAGKVRVAMAKGEQMAPGLIADKYGRPTTNPADCFDGGLMLPVGGHKGYGLATVVELLAQAVTGSLDYKEANRGGVFYGTAGTLLVAFRPDLFRPDAEYEQNVAATISRVKDIPPAPGFEKVLMPGEPERNARAQRREEGIGVAEASWEAIKATAAPLGIDAQALVEAQ